MIVIIGRVVYVNNKQGFLFYTGISCILLGVGFLLYMHNILPNIFLVEYINILIGIILFITYLKNKNMFALMGATFFFANAVMLFADKLLGISNLGARMVFIPGVILLVAYIFKKHSVILTVGSILTFWGIFLIIKEPAGIYGFRFSVGALMLFTVLAFILIGIIERQSWPILPSLILGTVGTYLIIDELQIAAREMVLQIGCALLIIIGVVFVIRSLFKKHLEEE